MSVTTSEDQILLLSRANSAGGNTLFDEEEVISPVCKTSLTMYVQRHIPSYQSLFIHAFGKNVTVRSEIITMT